MKHRLFFARWSLLLGGVLSAPLLFGEDSVARVPPFSLLCKGVEPEQLEVHLFAYEDLTPIYAEIYGTSPFYRQGTFRTIKTRRLEKYWLEYKGKNTYEDSFVLTVPPAGGKEKLGHLKTLILMRDTQQQITCGSWKRGAPAVFLMDPL